MAVLSEVVLDEGGALVLRKRAEIAADRRRLRHEERILARAAHPGVVGVAAFTDAEAATVLDLRWAGNRPLVPGSLSPAPATAVVSSLADTVAWLHDQHLTHGRIGAEHVVLADLGHPILCGFAEATDHRATRDDTTAAGAEAADTGRFAAARAADVAALGDLLTLLLGEGTDEEPIPHRRRRRSRVAPVWPRRSLLTLADQASSPDVDARPTARRFAELLTQAVPEHHVEPVPPSDRPRTITITPPCAGTIGDEPDGREPPASTHRFGRRAALLALLALAGLTLVVVGATALASPSRAHVDATPPSHRPAAAHHRPASSAPTDDTVTVSGRNVAVGDRHYELGRPGDVVAVGDWTCRGRATAALLRPATGEVFVFTRWATAGHDLTIRPTEVIPGARRLRRGPSSGARSCPALLAVHADGTTTAVTTTRGTAPAGSTGAGAPGS